MKSLKLISLAIAMLISYLSFGQDSNVNEQVLKTITGIVSDVSGPLPGVNIFVKGTQRGVSTGFDGKYAIKAQKGEILVYSFLGFNDVNRIVTEGNVINVLMKDNAKTLECVVVTSYGTRKSKKSVAYSVQKVSSQSISNTLSGRASGLLVNSKNSNKIVLRGNSSIESEVIKREKQDKKMISSNDEDYNTFVENEFESPKSSPLSTFSIDVDNASYTNICRFINGGQTVPKDAVRVEEMMNFFKYQYPQPLDNNPFSINTEYSDCAWNNKHKLVKIGLQGKNIPTENLPASNLVFLIDVSGSMSDENKLPLLVQSLKILVEQLRKEDKVAIVVYAGAAGLVLPPTAGNDKKTIIESLEKLNAGGSTAGGQGIELAYKIAEDNFIKDGNNRVILATDGDFNVGASSDNDMERLIEKKRKTDIFLTCLGYGMGNYKDSKLETLADKGNGNYAYIDNIQEANRFLGKEFKGSMFAIAKDVKIQIEFNPKHVQSYRLIGYENRKLRAEDFKNDAIDAGELGSGHSVTALYEIIPTGIKSDFFDDNTTLKYSKVQPTENNNDELATIKFRYKKPDSSKFASKYFR
jgi:Ca-activated chloride channel homolog